MQALLFGGAGCRRAGISPVFSQPARAPGSSPRGVGNPRPASLPRAPPGKQRLAVPTEGRAGRGPASAIGGAGGSAATDAVRASSGRVQAGVEGSAGRPQAAFPSEGAGRTHPPAAGRRRPAGSAATAELAIQRASSPPQSWGLSWGEGAGAREQ